MSMSGTGMDPMTLMMLQSIMGGSRGQQAPAQSQGVSGPFGQVQQAAPASAMGGVANAIAPLQQAMLINALRKRTQQPSPQPEPTGYPTQQPPSPWTTEER